VARVINGWVVLGSAITFAILLAIWAMVLWYFHPADDSIQPAKAVVTVIVGPTMTPIVTPSPTGENAGQGTDNLQSGLSVGTYVQISGTESAGLRLRIAAGIGSKTQFVALEGEVFEITAGPQEQDGYTWWYLVSPYDSSRSGWGASSFMAVISSP